MLTSLKRVMNRFVALLAIWSVASVAIAANQAPTANIFEPPNGLLYSAPATVVLKATATDPDGTISKVEFYRGTTLIGTATTGPNYTVTWPSAPAGAYTITAKPYDNLNKVGTSNSVQINIVNVTTTVTQPANGATVTGRSVTVQGGFVGPATTSVIVTAGGGHSVVATVSGSTYTALNVPLRLGQNGIEVQVARRDGTAEIGTSTVTAIDPPLAVITSPANCTVSLGSTITLAADADAFAPATITSVEFIDVDDSNRSIATITSAPYSTSFTPVLAGHHHIVARVRDSAGNVVDSTPLDLLAQSAPPSVSLLSPPNGYTSDGSQPIALQVSVSAVAPSTIARVEYWASGQKISTETTPPYSSTWSNPPPGFTYNVTAIAYDSVGAFAESTPPHAVTITTPPPNDPPTVVMVDPTGATPLAPLTPIAINVNATDTDGVSLVEFFADGVKIGETAGTPYQASWSFAAPGTHTISATAHDTRGATASASVQVTIAFAAGESVTYLHTDFAGSPIMASDGAGTVLWKESYQPYGSRTIGLGTSSSQLFQGKAMEMETGLSYFGARYYDPVVGRFMGIDPVRQSEGSVHGLNRYAYANDNPFSFIDTNGKWSEAVHHQIIDFAFSNWSSRERNAIKAGSNQVDVAWKQIPGLGKSFEHAMREEGQTPQDAEARMWRFVETNLAEYRRLLYEANDERGAWEALGRAIHPIMDSTSSAHEGFQEWKLFGGTPYRHGDFAGSEESSISRETLERTARLIQRVINGERKLDQ